MPHTLTLVSFDASDGQNTSGAIIVDPAADLFGTTLGGADGIAAENARNHRDLVGRYGAGEL